MTVTAAGSNAPARSATANAAVRRPSTRSGSNSVRTGPGEAATSAGIARNAVPNSGPQASAAPSSSTAMA